MIIETCRMTHWKRILLKLDFNSNWGFVHPQWSHRAVSFLPWIDLIFHCRIRRVYFIHLFLTHYSKLNGDLSCRCLGWKKMGTTTLTMKYTHGYWIIHTDMINIHGRLMCTQEKHVYTWWKFPLPNRRTNTPRTRPTSIDRIITGTGFVTRTCMIHSLVDSSSFSNVRTNDYRNVSCDSFEENPLEVGLQFQLRIRPSPMVSSRRFLFTLNWFYLSL